MKEKENMTEIEYHFYLNLMCTIRNSISLICWTFLAIVFKIWWIALFSILFLVSIKGDDKDE
jgi:hypothetical protein